MKDGRKTRKRNISPKQNKTEKTSQERKKKYKKKTQRQGQHTSAVINECKQMNMKTSSSIAESATRSDNMPLVAFLF